MPRKQQFNMQGGKTLHIMDGFNGFVEVQDWMRQRSMELSENTRLLNNIFSPDIIQRQIESGWYGNKANYKEMMQGIKQFAEPEKLAKVEETVTAKIDPKIFGLIKKRKLKFTDAFGVFSFDRAAQGLYILDEFYSKKHGKVVQPEEVEEYQPETYRLISDNSNVEKRKELRENGTKFYRTSIKKVFAYFPQQDKNTRAVELYVTAAAPAGLSGDDMMYNGVAAIIIAKILTIAGVKVSIKSVPLTQIRGDYYSAIYNVKTYGEPLDVNAVAVALSDARFIRNDNYKIFVHCPDEFGQQSENGLGTPVRPFQVMELLDKSGYLQTREIPDAKGIVMGSTFSESAAIEQVEETITLLAEVFNTTMVGAK